MIRAYSKRLLSPFTGQVQIVETDKARALTLGGDKWELQYRLQLPEDPHALQQDAATARKHSYLRVAIIRESGIERLPIPTHLDTDDVEQQLQLIAKYLEDVSVPLPAADLHEYWLLDEADGQPLALIYSCVDAGEMPSFPHHPEWTATPSSIMKVATIPAEEKHYVPPVNYRFEQLVNERAGRHPKARWIKRREGLSETFPSFLVREDWDKEEDRLLCQRYIERQAPRLLMLHDLEFDDRRRLEGYARQNALEVERFCHLYPEVADDKVMSAIRVEAQLRISAGDTQ